MSDQTPPAQPSDPQGQQSPPPLPPYPGDSAAQPQQPGAYPPPPGAYPPPGSYPAPGAYGPAADQRPGNVTGAAVTSIVLASIGIVVFAILGLVAISGNEDFVEGMAGAPGMDEFTDSEVRDIAAFIGVVFLVFAVWSVVTVVTATLSLRRHNWARILTVITAGVWAVLGVLNLVTGNPAGIVTTGAGVAVVILYLTGQANPWYRAKNAQWA